MIDTVCGARDLGVGARRVLLIDDEEDIRAVATVSLELVGGWEVRACASGPEGIAAARAERPDAILLDAMLPGLDGPSVLASLRADPATRTIPVVMLTARVQESDRRRWEALGVPLVAKPFDPLTLPREVGRLLGWPMSRPPGTASPDL